MSNTRRIITLCRASTWASGWTCTPARRWSNSTTGNNASPPTRAGTGPGSPPTRAPRPSGTGLPRLPGPVEPQQTLPRSRLNGACRLANQAGLARLKQVKHILENNRDQCPDSPRYDHRTAPGLREQAGIENLPSPAPWRRRSRTQPLLVSVSRWSFQLFYRVPTYCLRALHESSVTDS